MEEANEEAEHKGWCDTELSTNEQTRKEKTAELDKAVAEATEIREKEKAENTQTIKDAQEAQTAVSQAVTVLKEFYEKAGEATALLQSKQEPEIFDEPYKGMQSENGGVLGMLEVIASDFARLETDTQAAEAEAQKAFDEFSSESAVNRAANAKDVEHKTTKKTNQEAALTAKKADLEGTQKELDAAL